MDFAPGWSYHREGLVPQGLQSRGQIIKFLAALSSSRSLVICWSVRRSVLPSVMFVNKTMGPYLGRVTFILKLCVLVGLGFGWSWLVFVLVCLG